MAKGYHVLAGLCRDLRNALLDDAEGGDEAGKQLDGFDELLELLYERGDGEIPVGPEGDEATSGDDADDAEPSVRSSEREKRTVRGLGTRRASPAELEPRARPQQFSTRERLAREARPRPGVPTRLCNSGRQ